MDNEVSANGSAPWSGQLEVRHGWAVWRGAVGDADPHCHFAAQAVISPDASALVSGRDRYVARCLLIEPLVPHRLEPCDHAELIFIDPTLCGTSEVPLPPDILAGGTLIGGGERSFWRAWRSGRRSAEASFDPRVEDTLSLIDRRLTEEHLSLLGAARAAGLSADRLRHLFMQEVGLPFRRYVLWRRVGLAVAAIGAGATVTQAAHGAGFADASHFARTLKAMFGVTASATLTTHP